MNQPIKVPKAAVLVATQIRRRIVLGELAEGTPLPNETELMRYYEVSRPTLREALRILEAESLVSVKRGASGGARVAHPEPSVAARHAALILRLQHTTIEDVFVARLIIEPAAVALLVEKARVEPNVLEPLWRLHDESTEAKGDPKRYGAIAARFHAKLIETSGNSTLALIASILLDIVEPHNQAIMSAMDLRGEIITHAQDDHEKLLRMLQTGDAGAVDLWREHMEGAAESAYEALGADAKIEFMEARD